MDETFLSDLIRIRRTIHRNPEIGFDVQRTAQLVYDELSTLGLALSTGIGRTGIVADLTVPGAASTVALRADMDALTIQEENNCDYRSEIPGRAHLCGHDAHTAMLIGAARLLSAKKSSLMRNVRFIFQPSEEAPPGGAIEMLADGALQGVDEVYALHVWPWLETGTIGVCEGACMAQGDSFVITVHGKGGHAGAPHETIDPIVISAEIVTAIQSVIARTISPLEPAVVSVTQIHSGSADNVISSSCLLRGTVRTYSQKTKQRIASQLQRLVTKISEAHGATAEWLYLDGYPLLVNDSKACQIVCKAAQGIVTPLYPAERALFGEDFAYFTQRVPGCFIQLGCRNLEKECIYPLHHPRFQIDEACLSLGALLFAQLCLRD